MAKFEFEFDHRFLKWLWLFGIKPGNSIVEVGDQTLTARFGPWTVVSPLVNIAGTQVTGPYKMYRVIGPRRSVKDGGLSFGTNTSAGVCICFKERVPGIDPFGRVKHPALTVTVKDIDGLVRALSQ